MAKNLLIVESPAKAKTIEGFLGKDFVVKSSYGHIRDLAKGDKAIDIANNFSQLYEVPADKAAIVKELKKLAKEAEMVWLASDEDREGEAISWHLFETLNLEESKTKRIVFHEITKTAIVKAIENPRKIDYPLVHAQQARRVLDRLVGFELSPVLWRKVKPQLSAGRVQSVAVRLIVDREREINAHNSSPYFNTNAVFLTKAENKTGFKSELNTKFDTEAETTEFLEENKNAEYRVGSVDVKPAKRSPAAPFTTSTLQQEASRKLGYSVSRTMSLAQKLYESGKITYMRTDSVNLSETALNAAQNAIEASYGKEYHQFRKYKTKNASAQEAHEAIRPTYFEHSTTTDGDLPERKLYELIWKRAIASQMSDAELERTYVKIDISTRKEKFETTGEVIKFDGFLKVYLEGKDDDDENEDEDTTTLPKLTVGQTLFPKQIIGTQRYTRPSARYTEAALVKKLEELGIGRPSTYAPTISTIQVRGYVEKAEREGKKRDYRVLSLVNNALKAETKTETTGADKGKLFPTDIGTVVNDFLVLHFKDVIDFNFTANVEKQFDEIAEGNVDWTVMMNDFYHPFHKTVELTLETADRASGERMLGKDPVTGKQISARIGRYGPFVQIGETVEGSEEKPRYASLTGGQMIETITLEEALELFKLPKVVGMYEDKEMKANNGRFGPYIQHNSVFISIPKEEDLHSITEARGIELIEEKRLKDANKVIKKFEENSSVQILNGRWGPYLAIGKENYKLPKTIDPEKLSLDECMQIAAATPPSKPVGKGRFAKKK